MHEYAEKYNIKQIRKLLSSSFNDSDFTDFVQDNFYQVYSQFGENYNLPKKIRQLIDFVIREQRIEDLLQALEEDYPSFYQKFGPYHRGQSLPESTPVAPSPVVQETIQQDDREQVRQIPVVSTRIGTPPLETKGNYYKYSCDRITQTQIFKENYDVSEKNQLAFQFYFIKGGERQSPYGLFTRIIYQYLSDSSSRRIFLRDDSYNLERAYTNLLNDLFRSFGFETNEFESTNDFTIEKLLESRLVSGVSYIPVEFRIYTFQWKRFIPKLIKKFTNEFCQVDHLASNRKMPRFLFFWSIVYSEEMTSRGLTSWWIRITLKWTLRMLSLSIDLRVLTLIFASDISRWLDDFGLDDALKYQIIESYFKQSGEYDMTEVEIALEKIINAYNDGYIQAEIHNKR